MNKKLFKLLQKYSIEIKNIDIISNELEIFFANTDLEDKKIIELLKIIAKIN